MAKVGFRDVRVYTSWRTHPKRLKLEHRLGPAAIVAVVDLWCWAGDFKPLGELDGMNAEEVEIAAGWRGKPGELVKNLLDLGLLDEIPGGFMLHDWETLQPWAIGAPGRSQKARVAAEVMHRKSGRFCSDDAQTPKSDARSEKSPARSEKSSAPSTQKELQESALRARSLEHGARAPAETVSPREVAGPSQTPSPNSHTGDGRAQSDADVPRYVESRHGAASGLLGDVHRAIPRPVLPPVHGAYATVNAAWSEFSGKDLVGRPRLIVDELLDSFPPEHVAAAIRAMAAGFREGLVRSPISAVKALAEETPLGAPMTWSGDQPSRARAPPAAKAAPRDGGLVERLKSELGYAPTGGSPVPGDGELVVQGKRIC